jgi:hypothetical protein
MRDEMPDVALVLRPKRRVGGFRRLRILLKSLLRRHGFRCVKLSLAGGQQGPRRGATPRPASGTADRIEPT